MNLTITGHYKGHDFSLNYDSFYFIERKYRKKDRKTLKKTFKVSFPNTLKIIKTREYLCVYFFNDFETNSSPPAGYYSDITPRIPKISVKCSKYPYEVINNNYICLLSKNDLTGVSVETVEQFTLGQINYEFKSYGKYNASTSLINDIPSLLEFKDTELGQKVYKSKNIVERFVKFTKLTRIYKFTDTKTMDLLRTSCELANKILEIEPRYSFKINKYSFEFYFNFYYDNKSIPVIISNVNFKNFFNESLEDYDFIGSCDYFNYGTTMIPMSFLFRSDTKYWKYYDTSKNTIQQSKKGSLFLLRKCQ